MTSVDDWDLSIAPIQLKIYPLYFNANKSWKQGRRVPMSLASKEPNIVCLTETIGKLGLKLKVEPNARHPKDPFTFGRVLVETKLPKKQILRQIASKMVTSIPESLVLQVDLSLSKWETISKDS